MTNRIALSIFLGSLMIPAAGLAAGPHSHGEGGAPSIAARHIPGHPSRINRARFLRHKRHYFGAHPRPHSHFYKRLRYWHYGYAPRRNPYKHFRFRGHRHRR